ncbi:MAG: hypothetical protein Q8N44_14870 [Rubrivivax sp.]|nr:hypothetical protein [Rubrivivax sp.]
MTPGVDIDGLHARLAAQGVAVLLAPTHQPWGLRECLIAGPAGHRQRLCAQAPEAREATGPAT